MDQFLRNRNPLNAENGPRHLYLEHPTPHPASPLNGDPQLVGPRRRFQIHPDQGLIACPIFLGIESNLLALKMPRRYSPSIRGQPDPENISLLEGRRDSIHSPDILPTETEPPPQRGDQ